MDATSALSATPITELTLTSPARSIARTLHMKLTRISEMTPALAMTPIIESKPTRIIAQALSIAPTVSVRLTLSATPTG